jgi:pre-60S factor REI1
MLLLVTNKHTLLLISLPNAVCLKESKKKESKKRSEGEVIKMLADPKCVTCGTVFGSLELMRKHFDTEFHLNNVRLRVEGKKPLTHHEFKVSASHAGNNGDEDGDGTGVPLFSCQLCKKSFRSVQTLQSHVKSTAHLMRKEQRIISRDSEAASMLSSTSLGSAAIGLHRRHKTHHKPDAAKAHRDPTVKVTALDREEDVSEVRCFFCGLLSPSFEDNTVHLKDSHDFSLPLAHRCRDPLGLMKYVARKINGLMCLVCNENTKKYETLDALRSHMREACHDCIILSPEYAEFYTGTLDDKDTPAEEIAGDALVVSGGGKTIVKRDAQDGLFQHKRETMEQVESRKAIMAQTSEANAVLRRERLEIMRPQLTQQAKDTQRIERRFQRERLKIGIRANKLHPKGYDGEGEVN